MYPLLEGGRCWWGGIDLDHDDLDAARRFLAVLSAWGLPGAVFSSRARGHHALSFLDSPAPSWAFRGLLALALREAGLPASTERFPKQDDPRQTKKGVGSFLRLPYFGGAAPGRRVALDAGGAPMSLEAFLGSVELAPSERVLALAELHGLTPEAGRQGVLRLTPARPRVLPALPGNPRDLGLSDRLAELVEHGWREGCGFLSRSELQAGVLAELVNLGHDDAVLWAVLLTPSWRLRERTSSTGRAGKDLGRSISRAREFAEQNDLRGWAGRITLEEQRRLRGDFVGQAVLADIRQHVTRATGFAVLTQAGIARRLGCGLDAVKKTVGRLKRHGLLEVLDLEARWQTGRRRRGYRIRSAPGKCPPGT